MANLNRLKVVLAEQQKTGKWLAEQIGKSNCTL
jgi:DNA-binding Xre family transcriptional regulator